MNKAQERFYHWARTPNLAVLKTSTTGLEGEVIELAVVTMAGEVLMDQRFEPSIPVEPGATRFHGITDSDLKGCPPFPSCWPELGQILLDRPVVAWAAEFQRKVIQNTLSDLQPGWDRRSTPDEKNVLTLAAGILTTLGFQKCVMEQYGTIWGQVNGKGQIVNQKFPEALIQQEIAHDDLPKSTLGDALRCVRLIEKVGGAL
jgi:hypothetical protein